MVETGKASSVSLPFVYTKRVQQNLKTSLMWHGRRLHRKKYICNHFLFQKKAEKGDKRQAVLPVFAASGQARRFALRILKHVQKYWLKFSENHCRHFEIALQSTYAATEVLREVRHVRPFLHLAEELDQTRRKT